VVRRSSRSREPGEVRRQKIVDLLRSEGYLRSTDISLNFDVSDETARRDLSLLDEQGHLRRVRGGAILPDAIEETEPSRAHREVADIKAKREIAVIARSFIENGQTVFFDVGTTVETAAAVLAPDFHGRVVTTSLHVGMILAASTNIEVEMIGGRVRPQEFTVHGSDALQSLSNYSADVAIIGCGGVTVDEGITDFTPGDIPLKRVMIEHSARSYVLADASKIGKVAVRHICPVSEVDAVITDASIDPSFIDPLRRANVEVLRPERLEMS